MITDKDLEDYETHTERYSGTNYIWKTKNLYSMIQGEPKAYYKDLNSENPTWVDEMVLIKPDGTRSLRLDSLLARLASNATRQSKSLAKKTTIPYSSKMSPSNILINNHYKDILSENNIKLAPLVRDLIEKELIERGLL